MLILEDVVAITSRNAGTVRTRTVGSSLYNMAVQTSNIISTQVRTSPLSSEMSVSRLFAQLLIYFIQCRSIRIKINRSTTPATRFFWASQLIMLSCLLEPSFIIHGRISTFLFEPEFKVLWSANMSLSQRDKIWDSMTREEKLNYLATTKDKGNKRYVFAFYYWTHFHRPVLTLVFVVLTSASPLDQ